MLKVGQIQNTSGKGNIKQVWLMRGHNFKYLLMGLYKKEGYNTGWMNLAESNSLTELRNLAKTY